LSKDESFHKSVLASLEREVEEDEREHDEITLRGDWTAKMKGDGDAAGRRRRHWIDGWRTDGWCMGSRRDARCGYLVTMLLVPIINYTADEYSVSIQ
jgi:hypothetical protein